ncbi:DUF6543 domain-containing protein [Pseudomonas fulva]|uniref:DUF6543 domain-containing protein n=1 Tax=Pseudomonas fulva TaxID=47880 RepID=UPI0018AAB8D8|nr:DUF6543 domain-containing protein [Pseudomonas fulva]MBF8776973.1 hypothetical protein [Pseudomonas fulva]
MPVADVDRLRTLEQVGLNLAQMAALFVPQLGELMLAATVTEVLSEVMTAVHDWSRGHQHEALEHVLGVAETVAVTALMAAGGGAVARGFKRSAFVDEMMPVEREDGGFWFDYLQRQHRALFEQVREPFVQQMEALYEGRESLTDADYDAQARSIAKASDEAVKATALELTRQSLTRERGQLQDQ